MATDLFDIHIRISQTNSGEYCARTIFDNNALLFERFNKHLTDSICDVMVDMEHAGMWTVLEITPAISQWPFGSSGKSPAANTATTPPAGVPTSRPPAGIPTPTPVPAPTPTPTPTPVPTAVPVAEKKKQVPAKLERPVDLSAILYPDCQVVCKSYDIFGASKCKSMCQTKKGV